MRGEYRGQFAGSPRAVVGASGIFGTGFGADGLSEIRDVDRDVNALGKQIFDQLPPSTLDRRFEFYHANWAPWREKWNAFRDDKTSTLSKITDFLKGPLLLRQAYFDVQPWRDQLRARWAEAKDAGFHLQGDEPQPGDKSIGEHASNAADKIEGWFEQFGTVAKYVLIGGLALGGVLVLSSIASNIRANRDPMAPYLAMARRTA